MTDILARLGISEVKAGVCCGVDNWMHDPQGAEFDV